MTRNPLERRAAHDGWGEEVSLCASPAPILDWPSPGSDRPGCCSWEHSEEDPSLQRRLCLYLQEFDLRGGMGCTDSIDSCGHKQCQTPGLMIQQELAERVGKSHVHPRWYASSDRWQNCMKLCCLLLFTDTLCWTLSASAPLDRLTCTGSADGDLCRAETQQLQFRGGNSFNLLSLRLAMVALGVKGLITF